jgi:hypothetical protein
VSLKQPFRPTGGATVNIDVASSTANVALTSGAQQRVMNNGTATAWILFGNDNTVAATVAGGMPVGPGVTEVLTPPPGTTYVAAIAAGSTGKIHFTPGAGV